MTNLTKKIGSPAPNMAITMYKAWRQLRMKPDTLSWRLRSALKLSPMNTVIREIARRGVTVSGLNSLEVFGYTGEHHTLCYFRRVANLEIWEIDGRHEAKLKKNLPGARSKITDSYAEIKTTEGRYDLIVIDNLPTTFGDSHCEHFDLLPDVYRVAKDPVIIIMNVVPFINEAVRRKYPWIGGARHLQARAQFYETDRPEEITPAEMVARYEEISREHGFGVEWSFFQRRDAAISYLTLKLRRATA